MSTVIQDAAQSRPADPPRSGCAPGRKLKLACIVSRFPKPTETFVLNELEALRRQGVDVEVYSLLPARCAQSRAGASLVRKFVELFWPPPAEPPRDPLAAQWQQQAHYSELISVPVLAAQVACLARQPLRYINALYAIVSHNLGSARYLAGTLLLFPRIVLLAQQLQRSGVTHVHAHFANHPTAAAFIVRCLTDLPYSFTAHGSDLHRDQHMLRQKVAAARFVVTISEFNREWILKYAGPEFEERVRVVHCGVDTTRFSPRSRLSRDPSRGRVRLLQIGSLHEVKGQRVLLEACAELTARGLDVCCEVVGDGPDRERLQQLAERLEIADRVTFHGYRTPAEICEHLAAADVLVCPSIRTADGRREGIPVVLMEAMSAGVPVIGSRLSGIPELIEHAATGLLFEPGDIGDLADCVQFFIDHPAAATACADAARHRVEADFDQSKNAARLARLLAGDTAC